MTPQRFQSAEPWPDDCFEPSWRPSPAAWLGARRNAAEPVPGGAGAYAAVNPESIANTVPMVDAAPSEQSHRIPDAISSGVLYRPSG